MCSRVGLLGCGAIGSVVARSLIAGEVPGVELARVLVRRRRLVAGDGGEERTLDSKVLDLTTMDEDEFFGDKDTASGKWDLCVEAAGQDALRKHGMRVLESGRSLLVTSVGAFTDDRLWKDYQSAAKMHGSRVLICAGAMPAVDWMGSAALAGVDRVFVRQTKPAHAWIGTPAEDTHDLVGMTDPTVIFRGKARESGSLFPKNSNISCTLALATAGLDATTVELVAVPGGNANLVDVEFEGPAGRLSVSMEGFPSPANPKTSMEVPLSVVKAIKNVCSPAALGV